MTNANTMAPRFETFTTFADASGAVAAVRVGPFLYACNWIGKVSIFCQGGPQSAGRVERRVAAAKAEAAFRARVERETTPEWRAACAAMYADA